MWPDKIYCINLGRRLDRRQLAHAEFTKLGLAVTFVPAVDAQALCISSTRSNIKPGMIGCYLSHIMLLQHCLLAGIDHIAILEDDAQLITGGVSLLEKAAQVIPADWQFAYLGYCLITGHRHVSSPVNNFWQVPGGSWGTQAYMIRGRAAILKVLEILEEMKDQVDLQLSNALPSSGLKYYGITPCAFKQRGRDSDVQ